MQYRLGKVFDSQTGSHQFSVYRWLSSVGFGALASGTLLAIATIMPVEAAHCSVSHQSKHYCLASADASAPEQKLRVGVAGSGPFVIKDEGKIKGISIDIWKTMRQA